MWLKHLKETGSVIVMSLVLLLAACSSGPSASPADATTETAPPAGQTAAEVPVDVTADGLSFPEEVPTGIVSFKLNNEGGPAGGIQIGRLNDDVTSDEFLSTMTQDPEAALSLVSTYGGPWRTTGPVEAQVVYDLVEGSYPCVLFSEEQQGPPLIGTFTTGEPSGASAPTADVTVEMTDFAFSMPDEVPAGEQTWQITNAGEQWHGMAIAQLNEGATIEDVTAWAVGGMQGPPPGQVIRGWEPMGAGRTAWVTWDLPPGDYTVICTLPDLEGDMASHLAKGMVHTLTVTE